MEWSAIGGGGATASGGQYSVASTIGQAAVGGPATGGPYDANAGFWEVPGGPELTIQFRAPDTIVISWPVPALGCFALQETVSLSASPWEDMVNPVTFADGVDQVTVKHFERCTPLVWEPVRCNSGWGLQIQNGRSRTSVQAGVISQPSPGQHWGLRPFSPPCSSLRISFVKKSSRSITGWRIHFHRSRSPTAETRRRERRQCRCESCREHQFPACKH